MEHLTDSLESLKKKYTPHAATYIQKLDKYLKEVLALEEAVKKAPYPERFEERMNHIQSQMQRYEKTFRLIFHLPLPIFYQSDAPLRLHDGEHTEEFWHEEKLHNTLQGRIIDQGVDRLVRAVSNYAHIYFTPEQPCSVDFIVEDKQLHEIILAIREANDYPALQLALLYQVNRYARANRQGFDIFFDKEGKNRVTELKLEPPFIELPIIKTIPNFKRITFRGEYESTDLEIDEASFQDHNYEGDVKNIFAQVEVGFGLIQLIQEELAE